MHTHLQYLRRDYATLGATGAETPLLLKLHSALNSTHPLQMSIIALVIVVV